MERSVFYYTLQKKISGRTTSEKKSLHRQKTTMTELSYFSAGSEEFLDSDLDVGEYDMDDEFMAPDLSEEVSSEEEEELSPSKEVDELVADLRPDERDPPPRSRKKTEFFKVDYASADKGHEADMAELESDGSEFSMEEEEDESYAPDQESDYSMMSSDSDSMM